MTQETAMSDTMADKFVIGSMGDGAPAIFSIERIIDGTGFIGRNIIAGAGVVAKPGYIPWAATDGIHRDLADALLAARSTKMTDSKSLDEIEALSDYDLARIKGYGTRFGLKLTASEADGLFARLDAAARERDRLRKEVERLTNPMNYDWVAIEDEGFSDPYDAADSKDLEPGDLLEVTACRQVGSLWVAQIDNKNARYFRTEEEARTALGASHDAR